MPEEQRMVTVYHCARCRHEWLPRSERRPEICPRCKSPYWDRERMGVIKSPPHVPRPGQRAYDTMQKRAASMRRRLGWPPQGWESPPGPLAVPVDRE